MTAVTIHHADCLAVLRTLPDASIHAIITDPPYGLADHKPTAVITALTAWANGDRASVPDGKGFMGRAWDAFVPPPAVWDECLRVLKPGGYLLCFAGTRTVDLMGLSIRLAGFEIRDSVTWLYGSGFPKSLDVSKAIDKAAGVTREVTGTRRSEGGRATAPGAEGQEGHHGHASTVIDIIVPATDAAREWSGWGTALKPASEPIIVARKPLGERTVAANVLAHGTGAVNVDACRVGDEVRVNPSVGNKPGGASLNMSVVGMPQDVAGKEAAGRWPTNVVLDEYAAAELDQQSGVLKTGAKKPGRTASRGRSAGLMGTPTDGAVTPHEASEGGASRFFPVFRYQAKAPTKERPKVDGKSHPTVKPLELMRWLVRLVTPPGGTVLDPFAGSGTTGQAAALEGFASVLVEFEADHIPLIEKRLTDAELAYELVIETGPAPEPTLLDLIHAATRYYSPVCTCGWTCTAAPRQKWRAAEFGDEHRLAQTSLLPDGNCTGCGRGREAWSCRCGGTCDV